MIRSLLIPALAAMLFVACGSSKDAKKTDPSGAPPEPIQAAEVETQIDGNTVIEKFDVNGDGKADVLKYSRMEPDPSDAGRSRKVLFRKEMDVNFDKRIDIVQHFNADATLNKEEYDLDFDGKVDTIIHYKEGKKSMVEMNLTFSGKMDTWKYYTKEGQLERKERDGNGDGKVDVWEYYEKSKDGKSLVLVQIQRDVDGDGKPDVTERVGQQPK